jgi:basic membrane lipoprotein Med (substrate-binding protein (PBP1-ABC) superfamily)
MVDYESALAVANLTQEEVDAIAHHEDMTATAAMELGNYLCQTPEGERRLKRIIIDEIEAARERGDHAGAARLRLVVKHFVETHPKAA